MHRSRKLRDTVRSLAWLRVEHGSQTMVGIRQFVRRVFRKGREAGQISLGLTELTQMDGKGSLLGAATGNPEHVPHPQNAPGPFYSENEGCIGEQGVIPLKAAHLICSQFGDRS